MPPTIGAAIGFMTSDPIPVSHHMGARLRITAVTVIKLRTKPLDGRIDCCLFDISLGQRLPFPSRC
jgi:hypothetical protein